MRNVEVPKLDIDAKIARIRGVPLKLSPRQVLERRITAALCAYLIERGWSVSGVHDGEEFTVATDTKAAMELVFNLDEAWIEFAKGDAAHRVFLVMGNSGWDIVSDWGFTKGDRDGFNDAMERFINTIEEVY